MPGSPTPCASQQPGTSILRTPFQSGSCQPGPRPVRHRPMSCGSVTKSHLPRRGRISLKRGNGYRVDNGGRGRPQPPMINVLSVQRRVGNDNGKNKEAQETAHQD